MNIQKSTIFNCAVLLAVLFSFSSCRKDDTNPIAPALQFGNGMMILNQGGFNDNNSSLDYYDFDTKDITGNFFQKVNGRGLGAVGNDLKIYGSKMYIVMNVSGTLEVTDAKTAQSIKQVSFKNGNQNRQPRYIVFNKNKAFISSYDGTVAVLDTTSLAVEKYITVGRNPEQMAIANNKLYVVNSGGLDFPNYDNSVSVIDLKTLNEIKKITIPMNPGRIAADEDGDLYILSTGNYNDVNPALTIINSSTDEIKKTIDGFDGTDIAISDDFAYITAFSAVKVFNVKTEELLKNNFVADGSAIAIPYTVAVNKSKNEIFISDAVDYAGSNGKIHCFDLSGNKKYSVSVGLFPGSIVFVNK